MRRLTLCLLFALAALNAEALVLDAACPGHPACPGVVTADAAVSGVTGTSANLTSVTSSNTIDGNNPIYAVAGNCAALQAAYPSTVLGAHALRDSGSATAFASGGTITVSGMNPGAVDQCIAYLHWSGVYAEEVKYTATFATSAGASQQLNWNPGAYFGFKWSQLFDGDGNRKTPAQIFGGDEMCQAGGENVKGVRIKCLWGECEPTLGDRSNIDFLVEIRDWLGSGACGGIPRQLATQLDYFANNAEALRCQCVPTDYCPQNDHRRHDSSFPASVHPGVAFWQNDSGRERCGARLHNGSSDVLARFTETWEYFATQLGTGVNARYLERFSPKSEGASGWQHSGDSTWDIQAELDIRLTLAQQIRGWAPQTAVTLGTNNFRAGHDDKLVTQWLPVMEAEGGYGIAWPDTWSRTVPPYTTHHAYNNQFFNRHMMWAEYQRTTVEHNSWLDAFNAAVNPATVDARADLNDFVPPNPSTTGWGATHTVHITTWNQTDPFDSSSSAFLTEWNAYTPKSFDATCPDAWVANGFVCVDNQGNVVP